MNVDVLHRRGKAVAERGPGAYVLTVSNDGRPHAVYLNVVWSDGLLVEGHCDERGTAEYNISLGDPSGEGHHELPHRTWRRLRPNHDDQLWRAALPL